MALICLGASKCALCGRVIESEDDFVATSAFLAREHRLWRYSDAAMHRACFLRWQDRWTFVHAFNAIVGPLLSGNGTRQQMLDDGTIETHVVDPVRHRLADVERAAADEAREVAQAEQQRLEAQWAGRPRRCPRCGARFVSVQDKGVCPACRYVFRASDGGGE